MPVTEPDEVARQRRLEALFNAVPALRTTVAWANLSFGPFVAGGEPHEFDARHAAHLMPGLASPPLGEDWANDQALTLALLTPGQLLIDRDTAADQAEHKLREAAESLDPQSLVNAVTAARLLLEPGRGRNPDASVGHLLLGSALLLAADDEEAWAEGMDELRRAAASPVPRFRIEALARLAVGYVIAFSHTGFAPQLDTAVEYIRECIEKDGAAQVAAKSRLRAIAAIVFHTRYTVTGSWQDNEAAVTQGSAALSTLPATCAYRSLLVMTVGCAAMQRHGLLGRPKDLTLADTLLQEALATVPQDSKHWLYLYGDAAAARCLSDTAAGLSRPVVDEALRLHSELPVLHPARITLGLYIADVLRRLPWPQPEERAGDSDDTLAVALLTEGITLFGAILKEMNSASEQGLFVPWGDALAAHGWLLCLRAHRTKDAGGLNEAVGYAQAASKMPPDRMIQRPVVLLRAGQVLLYAYTALQDTGLLTEAVLPLREAFRAAKDSLSGAELAPYRAALALALEEQLSHQRSSDQMLSGRTDDSTRELHCRQRDRWEEDMAQLADETVGIVVPLLDEVGEQDADHRYFQWCLGHIVDAVARWHDVAEEAPDPVLLLQQCTSGVSTESPERTRYFASLSSALDAGEDRHDTAATCRAAALAPTRDLRGRLEAAHMWLGLTFETQWRDLPAREAAESVVGLRLRLHEAFPETGQRLAVLGEEPWAPQVAAWAMLAAGRALGKPERGIEDAVRVLDTARCTLAHRMSPRLPDTGYDLDALRRDAEDGPLVLLNPIDRGCEAILVCRDGVEARELPVTEEVARSIHLKLVEGLQRSEDAGWQEENKKTQLVAQAQVAEALALVWQNVTRPVLEALGLHRPDAAGASRRIWWIPAGALALLPLHSALPRPQDGDAPEHERLGALGLVTSSYASSLSMLRAARAGRTAPPAPPGILAVAGAPGLVDAEEEARSIAAEFPQSLALVNHAATRARVLRELSGYPWAHFACHAISQTFSSSSCMGELLVHDHNRTPLTGLDIAQLHLPGAELAFLSACETATPEGFNTNEAFHLASAFHLAGYRQVISTLWPVESFAAKEMALAFYAEVRATHGRPAAECIQAATLRLRGKYPNLPLLWAGHTHSGA
ncbi:CHAT domain-containing protein [Streptomyces sp. NPDC006458]|uniref:CHAT domain-containing protein n=1 Tax=Streptomyces sp. NPDC006458 TaxID=3154302 RepID=UPI00339FD575